jgi:hypothetical protein
MVPHFGRCKRRKVVEFELPEEVKRLLLLYRGKRRVPARRLTELAENGRRSLPPRASGSDDVVRPHTGTAKAPRATIGPRAQVWRDQLAALVGFAPKSL